MNFVLSELVKGPFNVSASRGDTSEILGVLLRLENPRARLSRTETKGTVFSALGELMWYLSETNNADFITYYLPGYKQETEEISGINVIYGGYGPRLFNMRSINQFNNVIELLRNKPTSRRGVIQLFNAEDISEAHKEIPCTCTLQFFNRDNCLHMFTSMRSNDAFIGLPHDIFTFTMIQEIMARRLGLELGSYSHAVGSLHLYHDKKNLAQQYLSEGYQSTDLIMPEMPIEDPTPSITMLLDIEYKLRNYEEINYCDYKLNPYWADIARLLEIHSDFKQKKYTKIENIKQKMSSSIYTTYIDKKIDSIPK